MDTLEKSYPLGFVNNLFTRPEERIVNWKQFLCFTDSLLIVQERMRIKKSCSEIWDNSYWLVFPRMLHIFGLMALCRDRLRNFPSFLALKWLSFILDQRLMDSALIDLSKQEDRVLWRSRGAPAGPFQQSCMLIFPLNFSRKLCFYDDTNLQARYVKTNEKSVKKLYWYYGSKCFA